MEWHRTLLSQNSSYEKDGQDVLVLDIQFCDDKQAISKTEGNNQPNGRIKRLTHSFGASYFMEDLIVDMSDCLQKLQVFSWHDWQTILTALQTPCDLWRFLLYHLEQLQQSEHDNVPAFESETALVSQFLQSPSWFETAIKVDNELIKLGIQSKPSAALVAMTLAHKNQSRTAQMYQQHMEQAATLWSQLSNQMIEMHSEKLSRDDEEDSKDESDEVPLDTRLSYWQ
ncbi:hypothetical protein [Psychrobacter sp.]|uniref:hypothetical protein n=1 Tax=Psychrobacter sp. TaxID=56811 RepID=UPI002648ECA6|nr:hypothetical protein [Psychrobacter sp.]MDN6276530.1 hypothetical protein [Psychrobacter sp.]MDN6307781.1 hypothetical protein [Psychrobacter sp.]